MEFCELREQILSDRDKVLFDEAVSCLNGGALRAAFITNWLCIAESLKAKLYEMSARDSEIQLEVITNIEEKEKNERPTDGVLIKYATEYGLISKECQKKFEHYKIMRGIYAHPLSSAPLREEVEVAIKVGVEAVLSQPALLRHSFVKSLMELIFRDPHYLDHVDYKIIKSAESTICHINPSVFPYMFKLLIEELDNIKNDNDAVRVKYRGTLFVKTLLRTRRDEFLQIGWNLGGLLQKFPETCSKLFSDVEFWALINENVQDMIIGHLLEPNIEGKTKKPTLDNIECVLEIYFSGKLTQRQEERFKSILQKVSHMTKAQTNIPIGWYYQELIDDLKIRDWYVQRDVVRTIKNLGPDPISLLSDDEQIQLGRNILQAADGHTTDAEDFIRTLNNTDNKWPMKFVEGILLETFINDNFKIRIKSLFRQSLSASFLLSEIDDIRLLVEDVVRFIANATQKDWRTADVFDMIIRDVENLKDYATKSRTLVVPFLETLELAFKETKERIAVD